MRWLAGYYRGAYRNDIGFWFATVVLLTVAMYKLAGWIAGVETGITFQGVWDEVEPPKLEPAHDTIIRALDVVTGREEVWCQYPIAQVEEAVELLNGLYGGQKLFWRQGEERPDRRAERLAHEARERERRRYITRPLVHKSVPIYRNNSYPPVILAWADTREEALALQQEFMRQGISTTVPGIGAY